MEVSEAKATQETEPCFADCDFRTLPTSAWEGLHKRFEALPKYAEVKKKEPAAMEVSPEAKATQATEPCFADCDFRTLPTSAWEGLHKRFEALPKYAEVKKKEPAAMKVSEAKATQATEPCFADCDFRTLPTSAWEGLHNRFEALPKYAEVKKKEPAAMEVSPEAKATQATEPCFADCDFRTLPTSAWEGLHKRFEALPKYAEVKKKEPAAMKVSEAKATQATEPCFADCDFRTLPTSAWEGLHERFEILPKYAEVKKKEPAAMEVSEAKATQATEPCFADCDFRTLPTSAWEGLHKRFETLPKYAEAPNSQESTQSLAVWIAL